MTGGAHDTRRPEEMTLKRMDNVLIVVEDLDAAKAFFTELGMELEGQTQVEGPSVDSTVGLNGVRADIAMMRTPDGHGRVELSTFHTPPAVRAEPENAPANTLGIRRIMFAVDELDDAGARLRTPPRPRRPPPPACAPTVPSSSARSPSTRTATGSASCVAPRASSSGWPSSSAEPSIERNIRGLGASWHPEGSSAIPRRGTLMPYVTLRRRAAATIAAAALAAVALAGPAAAAT